eukprot:SAG31_NODE_5006_length_2806_cov_2.510898_4_plen_164_part_00
MVREHGGESKRGKHGGRRRPYRVTLSRLFPGYSVRTWEIQQEILSHKNEKVTLLTTIRPRTGCRRMWPPIGPSLGICDNLAGEDSRAQGAQDAWKIPPARPRRRNWSHGWDRFYKTLPHAHPAAFSSSTVWTGTIQIDWLQHSTDTASRVAKSIEVRVRRPGR